jgi:tRNA threonylcarbamoyladenosine biosynthesis protein TsaE
MKRYHTSSPEETVALGRFFGSLLHPGDVVALTGSLGSGKTLFVRGVCEALCATGHIGSPTFTLINEYPAPFGAVVHIDLYRIDSRAELADLGIQEYFTETCICLIEWAESVCDILPRGYRMVTLAFGTDEGERIITIRQGEEAGD